MWSMHINILTPVIKYSVCSNNSLADLWPATSRICLALLQDVSAAARSKSNGNAVIDCFFSKHIRATLESLWCYRNTLGQFQWSLQGMVWLAKWIKTSTPRNLITLPSPCLEVTIKHFICSIAYLFFFNPTSNKDLSAIRTFIVSILSLLCVYLLILIFSFYWSSFFLANVLKRPVSKKSPPISFS